MGYTHYIENKDGFTDAQWKKFCKGVKEIFKNSEVPLGNANGEVGTKPEITKNFVMFNGIGDDSYESCCIYKGKDNRFNCCKTEFRSYDSIVCKVYNLAKKCNPTIEISTDGSLDENGDIIELDMETIERDMETIERDCKKWGMRI